MGKIIHKISYTCCKIIHFFQILIKRRKNMITFIAFLLTILGCINWLLIGLLQYDFIAGLFGFQASIFSRLVYILFGIGAFYIVIRTIANKGSFKIYEKRKKKENSPSQIPSSSNTEAGKEISHKQSIQADNVSENLKDLDEIQRKRQFENDALARQNNLFDEHFEDED